MNSFNKGDVNRRRQRKETVFIILFKEQVA